MVFTAMILACLASDPTHCVHAARAFDTEEVCKTEIKEVTQFVINAFGRALHLPPGTPVTYKADCVEGDHTDVIDKEKEQINGAPLAVPDSPTEAAPPAEAVDPWATQ